MGDNPAPKWLQGSLLQVDVSQIVVHEADEADAVVDRLDSEAPGVDLARRWKRKRVRTIIVVDPSGATCSARGRDVAPWPVGRCGAGRLLPPRPRTGGVGENGSAHGRTPVTN